MYKFKFADIGEGIHEGKLLKWEVKVGDKVEDGDTLFSVETDKITAEIPCPVDGTIAKLNYKEGDVIHVGDIVVVIDDGTGDSAAAPAPAKVEAPKETVEAIEEPDAGGVVGEIKVSNELFPSFGGAAPKAPATSNTIVKEDDVSNANDKRTQDGPKVDCEKTYDLIIVGAGPGGYVAAEHAAKNGLKTAIIEREFFGGVCLNVGCIPTKALLKSAKVYKQIKHMQDYGFGMELAEEQINAIKPNWKTVMNRKNEVVGQLTKGVAFLMRSNKVDTYTGEAKYIGDHAIEVNGKKLAYKKLIIATGSRARRIPINGLEEGYKAGFVATSKEALSWTEIPKNLIVIGAGVIGVEFACLFDALGSKVTMLQNIDKILEILDKDIQKTLFDSFVKRGIDIKLSANISKINKDSVELSIGDKIIKIKADKVLISVGRVPNIEAFKDMPNLEIGKRGEIVVDDYCQTSVQDVYAIGDVNGRLMLAHVASAEGVSVVDTIVGHKTRTNYETNPSCIYTFPESSSVGITEQFAKENKLDVVVQKTPYRVSGKALADGETEGFCKIIADKKTGTLLGAHFVGQSSTDIISELSAFMDLEGTVYDLSRTIHPHPTIAELVSETCRHAIYKLNKANK